MTNKERKRTYEHINVNASPICDGNTKIVMRLSRINSDISDVISKVHLRKCSFRVMPCLLPTNLVELLRQGCK